MSKKFQLFYSLSATSSSPIVVAHFTGAPQVIHKLSPEGLLDAFLKPHYVMSQHSETPGSSAPGEHIWVQDKQPETRQRDNNKTDVTMLGEATSTLSTLALCR